MPVPDLKITLDRYLGSLRPVISEQQYNNTLEIVKDFMRHQGPQLQRDLKEYANKCQNWVSVMLVLVANDNKRKCFYYAIKIDRERHRLGRLLVVIS